MSSEAKMKGRGNGVVHIVGAGPGAPDLLTLRAARLLEQASIVFYDALVHPDTVALAARAEKIAVGKRCGKHSTAQRFINKQLIDAAARYPIVIRLKGGDPMLFGRAQEEIAALEAAGVRYQIVPGVTAALAASAELGTSLTQRGLARSVAFATPRVGEGEAPSDWAKGIAAADSGAIYMGAGESRAIADALVAAGKSPGLPVAVVENASLPTARVFYTTLAALPGLADIGVAGPAIIFIGAQYRARSDATATERADGRVPARAAEA
jgi:uroporphyrin-III C-methyltransferase